MDQKLTDNIVYYATSNKEKFLDARRFLSVNENCPWLEFFEIVFHEVQIKDVKEIALRKGREAYAKIQKPVFTDDEAVYFESLPTFPGTLAKHVMAGIKLSGIYKVVKPGDRVAIVCELVFTYGKDLQKAFSSRIDGIVAPWQSSFATDPEPCFAKMVIPNGFDRTYYQIKQDPVEGAFFGSRINALEQFVDWWKKEKPLSSLGEIE